MVQPVRTLKPLLTGIIGKMIAWALPFGPGSSGLRIRSVRQAGLLRTLHIPNARV